MIGLLRKLSWLLSLFLFGGGLFGLLSDGPGHMADYGIPALFGLGVMMILFLTRQRNERLLDFTGRRNDN